jgi:hypothetical protein
MKVLSGTVILCNQSDKYVTLLCTGTQWLNTIDINVLRFGTYVDRLK